MTWAAIILFINNYKYPVLIGVILLVLGLFGGYGAYLYKKNKELYDINIILNGKIIKHEQEIRSIRSNIVSINKSKESILYTLRKQDRDYKKFRDSLHRDVYKGKKSFEELSKKKTKMVENIINKATSSAIKDIEEVSK